MLSTALGAIQYDSRQHCVIFCEEGLALCTKYNFLDLLITFS